MPKLSHRPKKGRRNNSKRNSSNSLIAVPRPLSSVPIVNPKSYSLRRTWNQQLSYNPTTGWSGSNSGNIQINFAASASNVNLGGVATYSPTLPNSSEFAGLFDQYRIVDVSLRIDYSINSVTPSNISSTPPLLYIVYDYDNSGDAALSDLLQYPGVVTHCFLSNGYTPYISKLKPRPLMDVASTGVLTAYSPAKVAPYIDTSYMTVPHYGVKMSIASMGGSVNAIIGYLNITAFIDIELINTR
jgi:hypothetical protein